MMKEQQKKILFLYTELADYFLNCLKELNTLPVEIHLVRWPVKKEAPFQFNIPSSITVYNRKDYTSKSLLKLAKELKPDLIYSSGWVDKGYVKICRSYFGKVPTISGMDNHWFGGFKQQLARLSSPVTIKKTFSHIWVPGSPQKIYAKKLGYCENYILEGFYTANIDYFNAVFSRHQAKKATDYPKRFLYVGRYTGVKGLFPLWKAFIELQEEQPNSWELICLGTGDDWDKRVIHPKIKHEGFVQPEQMENYLEHTGVFILPSLHEPWGVVVHEMAAAGFPLLCSNTVGAATAFLEENQNGLSFQAGDKDAIKEVMKKIISLDSKELIEMGRHSHKLAQKITTKTWNREIHKVL